MGNVLGPAAPRAPRRGEPLGSPGSFDELHRQCKEVFPQQMEGVKLIVTKTLSSHFQVTHTVHMSTLGPSSYHFNATFVGDRQLGPTETHQAKFVTWQFDGEYRGDDCTATLTLGNPDLLGESVILVAHFLQSVTSRLVLGGEMVYHRRPGEEGAILTLAGKYTALKWVATLNVGYGGAHASYYHRANEQVQVGVELEANTRLQDTTFAFGYQLNLPQANVVFRGERGAAPAPLAQAGRSPRPPPQGSWTVTGASGGCWRRSCPPCPSPWLWAPSSTTGRTVSTAASASSWAEGLQGQAARATVLLRESLRRAVPCCGAEGARRGGTRSLTAGGRCVTVRGGC
ncbi:mitochondrial import receptor subunit TOM40B isoform 2-T2 [Ciconia maguari]